MNEEKILILFGAHVRHIRQKKDISQEHLAHLSELDRTYISGIERGRRNISLINIMRLASALNVPPAELLSFNQRGDS